MKITIEAESKEIADLVLAVQGQQKKEELFSLKDLCEDREPMKISDVKKRLGTYVKFNSDKHHICSDYILTGCIIRKDSDNNFYYLAELNDPKQRKCMLLVRLEEIE